VRYAFNNIGTWLPTNIRLDSVPAIIANESIPIVIPPFADIDTETKAEFSILP
jgi:hypothetical protein